MIILVGDAVIGAGDEANVAFLKGLLEAILLGLMVGGTVIIDGAPEGDAEGPSVVLTVGDVVGGTATVHATTLPETSVR
jgi:hypothetical protein